MSYGERARERAARWFRLNPDEPPDDAESIASKREAFAEELEALLAAVAEEAERRGRKEEREACAKEVEDGYFVVECPDCYGEVVSEVHSIAAAIRSRAPEGRDGG